MTADTTNWCAACAEFVTGGLASAMKLRSCAGLCHGKNSLTGVPPARLNEQREPRLQTLPRPSTFYLLMGIVAQQTFAYHLPSYYSAARAVLKYSVPGF